MGKEGTHNKGIGARERGEAEEAILSEGGLRLGLSFSGEPPLSFFLFPFPWAHAEARSLKRRVHWTWTLDSHTIFLHPHMGGGNMCVRVCLCVRVCVLALSFSLL